MLIKTVEDKIMINLGYIKRNKCMNILVILLSLIISSCTPSVRYWPNIKIQNDTYENLYVYYDGHIQKIPFGDSTRIFKEKFSSSDIFYFYQDDKKHCFLYSATYLELKKQDDMKKISSPHPYDASLCRPAPKE